MSTKSFQPIFVVGTGRSGSTVFFDMFAKHQNVAWLSSLARSFPGRPGLNRLLLNLHGLPLIDRLLDKYFGPSEAYPFWERNCPGFSNPYRDLLADDVTPATAGRIRALLAQMVTPLRSRFVAKITGWPRVRYLRELFPEAVFVEVARDPCATVSSLLEVPFWDGWRGPPNWRRGPLPADLDALWRREKESFVALAAIEYVMVERAMAACRSSLSGNQLHAVEYSRLCANPIEVFKEVTAFCGLGWPTTFEQAIRGFRLVDRDDQWRNRLSAGQQSILLRTLEQAKELDNP